jgi:hypothetical protein
VKIPPLRASKFYAVALLIVAVSVIALFTGDASAKTELGGFASHYVEGVAADSALAIFLIGLAVGVPAGIGLFFAYLVMRERAETEQDRELDSLLSSVSDSSNDVWGRESAESRELFEREGSEERVDPWERPADWWRHAGDDA